MLFRYKQNDKGKQVRQAIVYTANEHKINLNSIDSEAVRIVHKLVANGYDAYIVGGAVRDLLLGNRPKDFDIVTDAEPSKIRRIFRYSRIIGKRFRLVHVVFGEKIYEVATFRSTKNGSVGNKFGTIEEDAHRRDFSINALYFNPLNEQLIDYVDGFNDLKNKRLTAVIPHNRIFIEDPVRMIRAVKYSVIADCKIPFKLRCNIYKNANLLEFVSPSRLTEEINKIACSGSCEKIVKYLIKYNLMQYIQPNAYSFIEDIPEFRNKCFQSLVELDEEVAKNNIKHQGQYLVYLLRDFIDVVLDTEGTPQEVFSKVYKDCRHFILPMNPQRVELAYAVKSCLKKYGFKSIKLQTVNKNFKKNRNSNFKRKKKKIQTQN